MRFLRSLLNSGVFMIVLVAMATLYIAYSTNGGSINQSTNIMNNVPTGNAAQKIESGSVLPPLSEPVAASSSSAQQPTQSVPIFATDSDTSDMRSSTEQSIVAQSKTDVAPPLVMDNDGQQAVAPPSGALPPPVPTMMTPMSPMMGYQPEMSVVPPQDYIPEGQQRAPLPPPSAPSMALIDQARAALFNGDLVFAEKSYIQLLTTENDPDLHGELGNVYFAQQNWQAAAKEYALAVDGLGAQGRFPQAQYVLGFLMQIDPDIGQQALVKLHNQLYPQQQQTN